MRAFKGFTKDLRSTCGNKDPNTTKFQMGEKKTVPSCKTFSCGFHAYEYPANCLSYYDWDKDNVIVEVEMSGDVDEDGDGKLASTEITLIKELTPVDMLRETVLYMIHHPKRDDWEVNRTNFKVWKDKAESEKESDPEKPVILIARGADPMVKGRENTLAALLKEQNGEIEAAKIFRIQKWMEGKRLYLKGGEVIAR